MKIRAATLLIVLHSAAASAAGSNTAALAVQAKVLSATACTVSTATVNFGEFLPGNVNQYGSGGKISVTCSANQAYRVALNAGGQYDATNKTRRMTDGSNLVSYALYKGSYGDEWGDAGTAAPTYPLGGTVPATGNGQAQVYDVLAKVFTTAQTPAGTYADNVLVTVSY